MNKQVLLSLLLLCAAVPLTAGKKRYKKRRKPQSVTGFVIEEPNFEREDCLAQVNDELRVYIESDVQEEGVRIASLEPWFPFFSDSEDDSDDEDAHPNPARKYPSTPPISIDTQCNKFFPCGPFHLYYRLCGLPLIKPMYRSEEIISEDNISFVDDHHTVVSRLKDGTVLVCNHHLKHVRPMYTIPIARTQGPHAETVRVDGNFIIVTNKDGRKFKLNHPILEKLLFDEDAECAKDKKSPEDETFPRLP